MKKVILVLMLSLVLGMTTSASASVITTALATGDNWLWGWNGSSWFQGPSFDYWQSGDTLTFTVSPGQPLDLYFAVMNETRATGNPAGFLAELSVSPPAVFQQTGTNKLLSNNSWDVAMVPYGTWTMTGVPPAEHSPTTAPIFNPTDSTLGLSWVKATPYGDNSNDPNAWSDISSISGNAQWLWTKKQFDYDEYGVYDGTSGQTHMDMLAVFHTRATVVPEPATMSLLGMGLFGLAGFKKKK